MGKAYKTKDRLMEELEFAQLRIAELEELEKEGEWAKNELRVSEEKFFKAFQASPCSMAIRSLKDGRFLDVNDAYTNTTGYSREELVGRVSSELGIVDHETIRTAKQIIDTQGFIRNWERSFKTKSGEIRTGLFSATVIQVEDDSCLLSAFQDITERKKAEETVQYRSDFESLIMNLSGFFINLSAADVDSGITDALQQIGEFAGVDRSYLFQFYEDGRKMDNTHEWCRQGIEPQIHMLKGIMVDRELPWFWQIIKRKEIFYIPRVANLPPEAVAEKRHFEAQGIQSLICLPMIGRGEFVGFLGFDSVREEKSWSEDVISLLKIIGEIFVNALDRAKSERSLRESEERWHFALEGAGDGVWDWDTQTNRVFFSRQWKAMLGFEEHEIGDSIDEWDKRVHPDDREYVYAEINRHFQGLTPVYISEHRVQCRDGSYKWILDRGKVMDQAPDGKVLRVIGTHTDITERKRVEEILYKMEREKSAILDGMSEIVIFLDADMKVIWSNRATNRHFNLHADQLVGRYCYKVLHGLERHCRICPVVKTIETGEPYTIDDFSSLGKRWTLRAYPVKDEKGNLTGIVEIVTDITERKQAEEALIRAEGKYRGIFENAVMGIFQTTPSGRIISANQAFARILGYDSPEEVLNTVTDIAQQVFVYPERRPELLKLMNEHSTLQAHEVQFFRKNGSIAWVTVTGRTVRDGSEKLLYYEGFIQDITDRKILESQLFQAQKMEAIGTLAGGIAHDFNNILSAIMGYTDMALTNPTVDDNLRHYLNQVFKAGERARDLVKQILTFSRQTDNELRPLKVSPIIKEVLKLLRASLPSTIKIRQDIQPEPDMVLADSTHIHQLMMNLCTNAAHAMHNKKGELKVSLGPVEINSHDTAIIHHGLTPGMYLQLVVNDTGTGIAPDIINRIFDPFFTTKRPGQGTGMGLSVAHGIVKSYNGAITVESEMGKGSVFRIYLPLLTEIEEKQEIKDEAYIPRGKEYILFVDDEEDLVHLGKEILTRLGYEVVERTNSLEALELFRTRSDLFDLVITDMTMPNMTGSELAQEIMRIRPDTPVIICTGFSEVITPEMAKAIGIKEFIMKPFIVNKLAVAVRHALDHKK